MKCISAPHSFGRRRRWPQTAVTSDKSAPICDASVVLTAGRPAVRIGVGRRNQSGEGVSVKNLQTPHPTSSCVLLKVAAHQLRLDHLACRRHGHLINDDEVLRPREFRESSFR